MPKWNTPNLDFLTLQPIRGAAPTEVIPETQLVQINDRGKIYKEILASIGLESPTTSQEIRNKYNEMDHNHDQGFQVVTTPIRNSATNLIAIGKHVLTPWQGKMWELRNKSPLGRQHELARGSR